MKVKSFGNLIQLTFFPGVFPINCYFVREEKGLTLIDTGLKMNGKKLIEIASVFEAPITQILLTHAHSDHAGSLHELHNTYPDVEICVSKREGRLLHGDRSLEQSEPQTALRDVFVSFPHPIRELAPGERIGSLEVVPCPGHTPGHIAFFDVRDKTLIAGDAFQTQGGIAVAGILQPLFPFPAFGTWHKSLSLESAKILQSFKSQKLAVGHGPVFIHPSNQIQRAIQVAEQRIHDNPGKY